MRFFPVVDSICPSAFMTALLLIKSQRKSHLEFQGLNTNPFPVARVLEGLAMTIGPWQVNKPQLVTAHMQNRPATSSHKQLSSTDRRLNP
ncbi:hypothetical protein I79_025669 [Cricetulus griseus]|uniref:Uncharacterized protein n=1 Tax=Cricetulus griseus TaxID=10029 RepID=G3INX3_CRIGR|nr:hypothetical protein I79_025669 [Cricetulus griseus]